MVNSVKTDRSLRYRVYHRDGELVGRTFHIEDAAALVALYATGATIKCCQRTVWTQGIDGDAGESYDHVADVAYARTHSKHGVELDPIIDTFKCMDPTAIDETIATTLDSKQATQETITEAAKVTAGQVTDRDDAFDFARATNLYLLAARDLGTCLGGNSITDLLADRTDWDLDKCKSMGDRVIDDPAIVTLLNSEGVPK